MSFPAEHFGSLKKRIWYKVKWMKNPPDREVKGKFDLLMQEDFEKYKNYLHVIEKVQTDSCASGLPVGFGKPEEEVDTWIAKNRQK